MSIFVVVNLLIPYIMGKDSPLYWGPPMLSSQAASNAAIPTGSVHKSRGDSMVKCVFSRRLCVRIIQGRVIFLFSVGPGCDKCVWGVLLLWWWWLWCVVLYRFVVLRGVL